VDDANRSCLWEVPHGFLHGFLHGPLWRADSQRSHTVFYTVFYTVLSGGPTLRGPARFSTRFSTRSSLEGILVLYSLCQRSGGCTLRRTTAMTTKAHYHYVRTWYPNAKPVLGCSSSRPYKHSAPQASSSASSPSLQARQLYKLVSPTSPSAALSSASSQLCKLASSTCSPALQAALSSTSSQLPPRLLAAVRGCGNPASFPDRAASSWAEDAARFRLRTAPCFSLPRCVGFFCARSRKGASLVLNFHCMCPFCAHHRGALGCLVQRPPPAPTYRRDRNLLSLLDRGGTRARSTEIPSYAPTTASPPRYVSQPTGPSCSSCARSQLGAHGEGLWERANDMRLVWGPK
jgi:hypothetical protein